MSIGIDIGKQAVHVARAAPDVPPKKYPQAKITLVEGWPEKLLAFIGDARTIVLEPTGWHLSRPIVAVLQAAGLHVFEITHTISHQIRSIHFSNKTDENDCRALAKAAQMVEAGEVLRGIKPARVNDAVLNLRLLLNEDRRLKREVVRAKNRLKVFVHGIDPAAKPAQLIKSTLEGDPASDGTLDRAIRFAHADLLDAQRQRLDLKQSIACAVAPFPVAAAWSTIPAYTPAAAAAFIVACDGAPEALDRDQFCAAIGRYPQRAQSGATDVSRKSKKGYRPALDALHMWSMQLLRQAENPISDYYAGGEKAGGKLFNAAKTKLARLLHGIATSGEPYRYTPSADIASKQKEE